MVRSGQTMRWYDRGADAVARVLPGLSRCYICPMCGAGFPPDSAHLLTREHVPPRGLGLETKALVLACRACNSRYGHLFDSEMARLETLARFGRGQMTDPVRTRFSIADITVNTDMVARGDTIEIVGLPTQNNPAIQAAFERDLFDLLQVGTAIKVTPPGYRPVQAIAGWLRVAYLIMFAALGYRYAFGPELRPVRAHLRDPKGSPLTGYHWSKRDADEGERMIMAIHTPATLRSILVGIGRHWILLPERGDFDFYDRMAMEARQSKTLIGKVVGTPVPWPREPMHALDIRDTMASLLRYRLAPGHVSDGQIPH